MGVPSAGSVVIVAFPFSDLTNAKRRPAIVLADAGMGDAILCMVTSNAYADPLALELVRSDFTTGSLRHVSYMRPGKLFTAHESLMDPPLGRLKPAALKRLRDAVVKIVRP
jgi:mRNA interferase MazF